MSEERKELAIDVKGVDRIFPVAGGEFQALKDINVSVPKGSLAILKGRSGSGKTTLMNIIGTLDAPTNGEIWIDGKSTKGMSGKQKEILRRTKMGFVFQAVSLIPTMNAFQNVEFSLRLAGIKEGRKERVEQCLKMVGLGKRMHHMPAEMMNRQRSWIVLQQQR